MAEAAGRVSDEDPAPVPIIYGDGVHDDAAGFQAAINGEPFEDRSGGVRRIPFDLSEPERGPFALMVERAHLVFDAPVSLARHRGNLNIADSNIRVRGVAFTDVAGEQFNLVGCQFNNAGLFEGFPATPSPDADARAESLLRSWLTPEQREQRTNAAGVFTVRGGSTGRQYQLGFGSCYELGDDGQNVAHLCFGPTDFRLPLPDRVLAQKLALECDEDTVLRMANRTLTGAAAAMQGAALAQRQAQALQNAAYAGGSAVVMAGLANQQRSAVDPLGLFSVARTAVGEPCVIDTDRMANLVQAAARELQMRERRQPGILCAVWGAVAFLSLGAFLLRHVLFN